MLEIITNSLTPIFSDPYARKEWCKLIYEYANENKKVSMLNIHEKLKKGLWLLAFKNDEKLYTKMKNLYQLDDNWDKCVCGDRLKLVNRLTGKGIFYCKNCKLVYKI